MSYKTNYELYARASLDLKRPYPSELVLNPLGNLYPHVSALQLQSDSDAWSNAGYFTGYHHVDYWARAYATDPIEEEYISKSRRLRRNSVVNKLRRFLFKEPRSPSTETMVRKRPHST
ncbi:hypothetical protein ASPZODRAFT_130123 [Penicilliopsis zonata CBS 506.65]|uniref:Uncharacterized protein n=1 Tax=Penicilliopsis zonata CBS 506.65 TaxID=1073090 RepID=A0A1L9SM87_9EURO|nr:hypothetical protein ASPZODRAFT_130123 [Penicilliopsis zonata CBS 506.65]OJJ48174.1 hypothetical protein ASPZODRAFT_130123 [Penicilliopsis zonata CBS 506.65]